MSEIGFPHTFDSTGNPRPIIARDVFNVGDFPCQLMWTPCMTAEEVEDFEAWLDGVKRRQRRWATAYHKHLTDRETSVPQDEL